MSYRWNEHTFLSPPYNFIEANFVCLNKKNNSDGIVKAEEDDSDDKQSPTITASSRRDTETNAVIVGKVTDNFDVAEVTINGEPVRLSSSGSFETSFYVPRSGKTIEIVAFDSKGNKATKSIKLERGAIQQATGPVFANLNPSGNGYLRAKTHLLSSLEFLIMNEHLLKQPMLIRTHRPSMTMRCLSWAYQQAILKSW